MEKTLLPTDVSRENHSLRLFLRRSPEFSIGYMDYTFGEHTISQRPLQEHIVVVRLVIAQTSQPFYLPLSKFNANNFSKIFSSVRSLFHPYAANTAASSRLCARSSQVGRALYKFVSVRFFSPLGCPSSADLESSEVTVTFHRSASLRGRSAKVTVTSRFNHLSLCSTNSFAAAAMA